MAPSEVRATAQALGLGQFANVRTYVLTAEEADLLRPRLERLVAERQERLRAARSRLATA
jgi:hypothetical protein